MESSSINELPSAAETLTSQNPSETTPVPTEPIASSDPHPMETVEEAVGEKRKRVEKDGEETKVSRSPWWKTSLCSHFRGKGSCHHGSDCKYAHGEEELRVKPDNTWDPTSERGKEAKARKCVEEEEEETNVDVLITEQMMDEEGCEDSVHDLTLSKCLVHLPQRWETNDLKKFVRDLGVEFKYAKKKRGMVVGFVTFENAEQLKSAVEVLEAQSFGNKNLKVADVLPRASDNKDGSKDSVKIKSAREAVTPLADLSYADQLEQKKASIAQWLKKLTRNARKACPNGRSLPEWILKARDIGGLSCKLEGIIESPVTNGYRNKCEFSAGYSVEGKITVGFLLGNFSKGVTAVEEPVDCPNISKIALQYASIFQTFLEKSKLPVWNKFKNCGFWRQLTVREGRKRGVFSVHEDAIAEVMLMVQVCTTDSDEAEVATEFEDMANAFAEGARACSPPLPLTVLVVQDHVGISNVAPPDCPLRVLPMSMSDNIIDQDQPTDNLTEARIHDHINNLQFSISPTAFFQVNTVAAEKLYSLAGDWADLGPNTLLFDVCCGTGTIGLTLAHRVGMVIGIEMNASAVLDAERNAKINGISNCKFICSKAEAVMDSLLKKYLEVEEATPTPGDSNEPIHSTEEMPDPNNPEEVKKDSSSSEPEPHFENVVAIVDPPRSGLHPDVIKALRTHPRLRRLVYISCNPESLMANAIELCAPSFENPDKGNSGYRGWRRMSTAGVARHRAKSMPASEPFRPVKAVAVDLFPHTDHCEMVMLLER